VVLLTETCRARPGADGDERGARTGATVRPSPSCATPSSQTTSSGSFESLGGGEGGAERKPDSHQSSQPLRHSRERHGTGSAFYVRGDSRPDHHRREDHEHCTWIPVRLLAVLGTGG